MRNRKRSTNMAFAGILLIGILFPGQSSGVIYDKATGGTRTVRMWLPDKAQVPVVKGVIVYGNWTSGGGDARPKADDSMYQLYGTSVGWGVLATQNFTRDDFSTGQGKEIEDALATFGTLSSRPELVNVPLSMFGYSNGGAIAYSFNTWKPERVVFFAIDKGGYYLPDTYSPGSTYRLSDPALKTPAFVNCAELDDQPYRVPNITALFNNNYGRGANWCFSIEEGVGHVETAKCIAMWLKYTDNAIKARYPANANPLSGPVTLLDIDKTRGWYVDQSTWESGITKIGSYAAYSGSTTQQGWVLDEDMAFMYRAFATYQNPITLSATYNQTAGSTIIVNVSVAGSYAGWSKIEIYNGAIKLGEILPGGSMTFTRTLVPKGLYGLTALGYRSNGSVLSTSNPVVALVGGNIQTPTRQVVQAPVVRENNSMPSKLAAFRGLVPANRMLNQRRYSLAGRVVSGCPGENHLVKASGMYLERQAK